MNPFKLLRELIHELKTLNENLDDMKKILAKFWTYKVEYNIIKNDK